MTHRMQRVNNLIRRELSEILYRDVKDPRLGNFVSVNEVDVSADLRTAQVYVSFYGSDGEKQDALQALGQASGFFHGELIGVVHPVFGLPFRPHPAGVSIHAEGRFGVRDLFDAHENFHYL